MLFLFVLYFHGIAIASGVIRHMVRYFQNKTSWETGSLKVKSKINVQKNFNIISK